MTHILKYTIALLILSTIILSGCQKIYVCYDGTTQKIASKCPRIPLPDITETQAGKAMDSFGTAIAQARGDTYTRVNLYSQNSTWYSGVLFTNKQQQDVRESKFRIDGKTAAVTCISGCEYVSFD